jgi:hypothetical protein
MKDILRQIGEKIGLQGRPDAAPARLFGTTLDPAAADARRPVPWEARAIDINAEPLTPGLGMAQLQALWGADKYMGQLDQPTIGRMKGLLNFCLVPPDQEFIRQDEHGDYMAVLLKGRVAVERTQSWGERLRLAEVVPGEMLGEMSLLDGGVRFSSCVTRSRCELAVLTADAMNRMLVDDADLVAGLMTLMARKMSLRLRVVGARLSDRI